MSLPAQSEERLSIKQLALIFLSAKADSKIDWLGEKNILDLASGGCLMGLLAPVHTGHVLIHVIFENATLRNTLNLYLKLDIAL